MLLRGHSLAAVSLKAGLILPCLRPQHPAYGSCSGRFVELNLVGQGQSTLQIKVSDFMLRTLTASTRRCLPQEKRLVKGTCLMSGRARPQARPTDPRASVPHTTTSWPPNTPLGPFPLPPPTWKARRICPGEYACAHVTFWLVFSPWGPVWSLGYNKLSGNPE